VARLKADPSAWYGANGVTAPLWLKSARQSGAPAEDIRIRHLTRFGREHELNRWAHFANIGLGTWLVAQPPLIGLAGGPLAWSEVASGLALILFASLSLSRPLWMARWACALVGLWVLFAPVLFWTLRRRPILAIP